MAPQSCPSGRQSCHTLRHLVTGCGLVLSVGGRRLWPPRHLLERGLLSAEQAAPEKHAASCELSPLESHNSPGLGACGSGQGTKGTYSRQERLSSLINDNNEL